MLKVVNLHQKPQKNRSQRKLELKYQGKHSQNRTKNHSTNPMPFFLARPTEKLYRNGLQCDIVTFQTVKQNLQHSRFFFVKYSYSVHSFFLFLKVRIIDLLRSDRCSWIKAPLFVQKSLKPLWRKFLRRHLWFLFEMHTGDKDVYKISFATRLPIVPVPPSTAPIVLVLRSFCVSGCFKFLQWYTF